MTRLISYALFLGSLALSVGHASGAPPFSGYEALSKAPTRSLDRRPPDSTYLGGPVKGPIKLVYADASDGALLDGKKCNVVGTLRRTLTKHEAHSHWEGRVRCDGRVYTLDPISSFNLDGPDTTIELAASSNPQAVSIVAVRDSLLELQWPGSDNKPVRCEGDAFVGPDGTWAGRAMCGASLNEVHFVGATLLGFQAYDWQDPGTMTALIVSRPFRVVTFAPYPALEGKICHTLGESQANGDRFMFARFVCEDGAKYTFDAHFPMLVREKMGPSSSKNRETLPFPKLGLWDRALQMQLLMPNKPFMKRFAGATKPPAVVYTTLDGSPHRCERTKTGTLTLIWDDWADLTGYTCKAYGSAAVEGPARAVNGLLRVSLTPTAKAGKRSP